MTKSEFTARSVRLADDLRDWLVGAAGHRELTAAETSAMQIATDIVEQTAVRLIRKGSDVH